MGQAEESGATPVLDPAARRAEWHRYYSRKRVPQQCLQLHLLDGLPVQRVLEVGPYLGFVTALLDNAGYEVTTLDLRAPGFDRPAVGHVSADLTRLNPDGIRGFDAILCCETLEHLWWDEAAEVLRAFHASGAGYLLLSVPYAGFQFAFSIQLNRMSLRTSTVLKMLKSFRDFKVSADPFGHKWEVGYRGYPLRAYEALMRAAGWRIVGREFTASTRSVFHLCVRG